MYEDLPPAGSTVGPWLILERFDSGSYGVVFRARRADAPESPPVALKLAKQPEDPRFTREAETLQRSHHPSIPRYVDMGLWTGPNGHSYPYLVMEWVKGLTPGTSAYRPPEQREFMYRFPEETEARWESRPSDDLYSLGVTLYRLVTGAYLPPCTDGAGLVERVVPRPLEKATVSPALDAIILRLIADVPKARGTAEQLVREALALVQAGGTSLNERIRATAPRRAPPAAQVERQHSDTIPAWLTWAGASALGAGLMALLVLFLVRPPPPEEDRRPWVATPEEVARFSPDAGVGEEAPASFQEVPRAMVPLYALGMPMPKTPFPSQRRPPCIDPEIQRVINGGCWVAIKGKEPPCGKSAFDYGDECFMPVYDAPRSPTSEEPR